MTSLLFLIYFASVGVSIVLGRQSGRHRAGMALECHRRGIIPPRSRPKVQTLEALVCISIGVIIATPAAHAFLINLRDAGFREIMAPETEDFYIFVFAAGLTLIATGCMALLSNRGSGSDAPARRMGDAGFSSSPPCSGESASEDLRHSPPPAG